jgi:hypothetical protein
MREPSVNSLATVSSKFIQHKFSYPTSYLTFEAHSQRMHHTGTPSALQPSFQLLAGYTARSVYEKSWFLKVLEMRAKSESYVGSSLTGYRYGRTATSAQAGTGQVLGWFAGGKGNGWIWWLLLLLLFGGFGGRIFCGHGWHGAPGLQTQHRPCESVNRKVSLCVNPDVMKQPSKAATVMRNVEHWLILRLHWPFHCLTQIIPHYITITPSTSYHEAKWNRTEFDRHLALFFYTSTYLSLWKLSITTIINQEQK